MAQLFTDAAIHAGLDARHGAVGAGAKLVIYEGAAPAGPSAALGGASAIATINLNSPAFLAAGSALAGAIDLDVTGLTGTVDVGVTNATATFFRILTSANAAVIQGPISGTPGTQDAMVLSNGTTLNEGDTVTISSYRTTAANRG